MREGRESGGGTCISERRFDWISIFGVRATPSVERSVRTPTTSARTPLLDHRDLSPLIPGFLDF